MKAPLLKSPTGIRCRSRPCQAVHPQSSRGATGPVAGVHIAPHPNHRSVPATPPNHPPLMTLFFLNQQQISSTAV